MEETEPATECITVRAAKEECPADLGCEDSGGAEGGVDPEVGEPYCFESDQVALKNNPDYQRLLKTVCVLEAQRARAIGDLEQLYLAQEKVLKDPIRYVDNLQRTGSLGLPLPGRQTLAELPPVDWKKYTSCLDFKAWGAHRQSARLKHQASDTAEDDQLQRLKSRLEGEAEPGEAAGAEAFVRGRYKDQSKSVTFNKLWTPEEQRRLDELLVKFPPEEVEARRWRKIATAFGDRTPQQIASRVQKYFQKLERNSLPVPGRVPARVAQRVRKLGQRHHHRHRAERDSTFLHSHQAPVWMKEDWDDHSCLPMGDFLSSSTSSSSTSLPAESTDGMDRGDNQGDKAGHAAADLSDEDDEDLRHTAEYRELAQLKELREEKLHTLHPSTPLHQGYKCDRCGGDPIVGVRWHCVDCPSTTSLDFCDTCYLNLGTFDTPGHNSSHRVRPVKRTWSKMDQDYSYRGSTTTAAQGYNYLDPNFMPAL